MTVKKHATKKRITKKAQEQLYTIEFSKTELEHLRDIFSVLLPSDEDLTISGALAEMKEQQEMEEELWKKFVVVFETANITTGEEAPDYVIATTAGLYQINHNEEE